jgi:antitoxin FitA
VLSSEVICHQRWQTTKDAIMAAVTIRNLSDEVHRALKLRAAQNNRSAEAEMRAILEAAVRPEGRVLLGTALSEASRRMGLTNADFEALEAALDEVRDRRPAEPMSFD